MAATIVSTQRTEFLLEEGNNRNGIQFEQTTLQNGNFGEIERKINVLRETPDLKERKTVFDEVTQFQGEDSFNEAVVVGEAEGLRAVMPMLSLLKDYELQQEEAKVAGFTKSRAQKEPITTFYPPLTTGGLYS